MLNLNVRVRMKTKQLFSLLLAIAAMLGIAFLVPDLPGLDAKALAGAKIDEKAMAHTEAIILSMTPAERENPSILNSSRKRRIAAGAGVGVVDINRLLKQFEMMQTMARQLSGKKMKRFQRGGGKMPFGF